MVSACAPLRPTTVSVAFELPSPAQAFPSRTFLAHYSNCESGSNREQKHTQMKRVTPCSKTSKILRHAREKAPSLSRACSISVSLKSCCTATDSAFRDHTLPARPTGWWFDNWRNVCLLLSSLNCLFLRNQFPLGHGDDAIGT